MDILLRRQYSQVFLTSGLDGRAAEIYAMRRAQLLSGLGSLCVIAGMPREPAAEEVWTHTWDRRVQDPVLLYLTGINQPGVYLVLDPLAKVQRDQCVLFLPQKNLGREFWDGVRLGVPERESDRESAEWKNLCRFIGFERVEDSAQLWDWLKKRLQSLRCNYCFSFWHEGGENSQKIRDHHFEFKSRLHSFLKKHAPHIALRNIASLHFRLRIPLDAARRRMIRLANTWTRDAFLETARSLRQCSNERELRARLEYHLQRRSTEGLAFPTIVAGGANAGVLHYQKCDDPLRDGDLILLDFGVRCGSVCSDVSRTLPFNGKFNPLQRLLYDIVLETQRYHQTQIRPGVLLREANLRSWQYLEELLRKRFLSRGGRMRRAYPLPGAPHPGPHGMSHLIGEQVHEGDVFRLYQDQPLAENMVISNEPGLYGFFAARIDGVDYAQELGIRIEDDLLVTRRGCENLSREIPKDPDQLEEIMAS